MCNTRCILSLISWLNLFLLAHRRGKEVLVSYARAGRAWDPRSSPLDLRFTCDWCKKDEKIKELEPL